MSPPKTDYTIPVNDFTPEEALLRLQRDTDLKITCEVRNMDVRYLDVYPDCQYFVSVIIESGDRGRTITGSGMSRYFPAAKEFACDHLCDQLRAMGLELPEITIPIYRLLSPAVFEALKFVCEEQGLPHPKYHLHRKNSSWVYTCIVGRTSKCGWHFESECARLKSAYKMMKILKTQDFSLLDVNKNPFFKESLYPTPIRFQNLFENSRIPYNRTLPSNYWNSVKTFKEEWGGIATRGTVGKVQASPWGSRGKQVTRRHNFDGFKRNESKRFLAFKRPTNRGRKRFDQGVRNGGSTHSVKLEGGINNSNGISGHSDLSLKRRRRDDLEKRPTSTGMDFKSLEDFACDQQRRDMDTNVTNKRIKIESADDQSSRISIKVEPSDSLPISNNMDDQLEQSSNKLKFEYLYDRRPITSNPSSESSNDRQSGNYYDWKWEIPKQSYTSSSTRGNVDLEQIPLKSLDRGDNLFGNPAPRKSSPMLFKRLKYDDWGVKLEKGKFTSLSFPIVDRFCLIH